MLLFRRSSCFAFLVLASVSLSISCGDDEVSNTADTGPSCMDGVKNGDETHRDCGGSCSACAPGNGCIQPEDCTSGVCRSGFCTMPACDDEVKNGDELDVDCGGPCGACAGGQVCIENEGCTSGVCQNGVCADTHCEDNELNVTETDVDCGGPSCEPCGTDARCVEASDCASNVCQGGNCLAPTCSDGQINQDESDQDCGGTCDPCNDGAMCQTPVDCQSDTCDRNRCISCVDGIQNGDETARDCGGMCDGCPAGQGCLDDNDCASDLCVNNACQNPGCDDDRANAEETDVDCGGPDCDTCADGKMCLAATDCESRVCDGTCQVPTCEDRVLNAAETDVDCGSTCGKCSDFRGCTVGTDCMSGSCTPSETCTIECDVSVGPDDGGYRACIFTPVTLSCPDISASGTAVEIARNDNSSLIDIGFSFEYYGETFTQVAIQANGALSFEAEPLGSDPFRLDRLRTTPPYDIIAIYWDSLLPTYDTVTPRGIMGSNIRYETVGTQPNRMFVVRWETPRYQFRYEDNDELGTFVGVLHENGEISGCYEDTVFDSDLSIYNGGDSATVGLFREQSILGAVSNDPLVPSGSEIRFTPR